MSDNNYVLWANRLKSGTADGILVETDQIYSNVGVGIWRFLDKTNPWVHHTFVDELNDHLRSEASNTGLSTSFVAQRLDVQSLILSSSMAGIGMSLSSQMGDLDTVLSKRITDLNTELSSQIVDLNKELSTKITDLDTELSSQIVDLNKELSTKITDLDTVLSKRITDLNTELSSQIVDLNKELSTKITDLDTELSSEITNLNETKHGDSFYDIETQYIYFFQNASDRAAWCIDKDINSDLILKKQKINHEFKTTLNDSSITLENYTGNTIVQLPAATQNSAGLMTSKDKVKLTELQDSIENKQEKMTIESKNISDYDVNYTIKKNSILKVTNDLNGELKISFEPTTVYDFGKFTQYGLYFSTGNNITNISLYAPTNVIWANENNISIEKNSTYEIIFTTHDNGATYTALWTRYSYIANSTSYKPYFTMDCTNNGGVLISRKNGSPVPSNEELFYYSVSEDNGATWSSWTQISIGSPLQLISGKKYRWKCNSHLNFQSGYTDNSASGHRSTYDVEAHSYTGNGLHYNFHFFAKDGSTPKVNLSGNILSLMFGDDFIGKEDETLPSGAFQKMFNPYTLTNYPSTNASSIIEAKDLILPSKTLSTGAYHQIFNGCTALKSTPKILAENAIGDYCCAEMFANCTDLIDAHELKITNFGTSIYACSGMFYGCRKLTKAVIPPATQIACGTYYIMYTNCSELIEVPDIPATEISKFENIECNVAMMRMFDGCTKLEKINGSLKIKIPGGGCYNQMFNGCTNLKVAPEILATQSAYRFCKQMFKGCTNLVVPPPYLPKYVTASSLGAYYEMFRGCSKLEYGPTLPAEVPIKQMYYQMFYGCSALKNIPYIGLHRIVGGIISGSCCDYMFYGCNALKHVELTKNIKYEADYREQSIGWLNRIFSGAESLKSIRLCYDLNRDDYTYAALCDYTYAALSGAFGFFLNENSSTRWYTRYTNNSAGQGGILYIPKSLSDKIKWLGYWESFCSQMVPSNWEVVAE